MGYYARYSGEIRIEPPLAWAELRAWQSSGDTDGLDVKMVIQEQTVDTEDGVLIRCQGVALAPYSGDSVKGYRTQEHLQAVVDMFPERAYPGRIQAVGEDGAQWAFRVVAGKVEEIIPEIVWPE